MADVRSAAAIGAALVALLACAGGANSETPKAIGATGTIEPRGGVVALTGAPGATITSIRVTVGQPVKRGDVLMTLDDRDARLDAALASTALAQARRHASQGAADEAAALSLAQDRAQRAEQEAAAYRAIGPNGTSETQLASFADSAESAREALAVEQRRSVQVRADAADEVADAAKRYGVALAKLAQYRIAAPSDGVVLQISQHVGEVLGGAPAVEMGDVSSMYVVCEAFQGDLLKIAPGMRASVTSNAFSQTLTGRVEWVGRLIQTKSQTGQFKIKLDDTALASRLVGMEVNVKVTP